MREFDKINKINFILLKSFYLIKKKLGTSKKKRLGNEQDLDRVRFEKSLLFLKQNRTKNYAPFIFEVWGMGVRQ